MIGKYSTQQLQGDLLGSPEPNTEDWERYSYKLTKAERRVYLYLREETFVSDTFTMAKATRRLRISREQIMRSMDGLAEKGLLVIEDEE